MTFSMRQPSRWCVAPRSVLSIEVLVEAILVEAVQQRSSALGAAEAWRSAMEKAEGEDWVSERRLNCVETYDDIAQEAFQNVRITAIVIGYELEVPECD